MKTTRAILFACLVLPMAIASGCGTGAEEYGEPVPSSDSTPIGRILARPGDYTDTTVVVEGRITRECPSGCWFEIEAGGAPILVELSGAGLAIPQRVGKTVRVVGTVSTSDAQAKLAGEGVEIR